MRTLKAARDKLLDLTPLKINCGRLCGGACCQPDEEEGCENGMLLFPYEERFYQKPVPGFDFHLVPDDTLYKGGKRLVCEGTCPREHRPLACRLFPLRLRVVTDDPAGEHAHAVAEWDPRAGHVCPLADEGGLQAMNPAFIRAAEEAGDLLIADTCMLEALYAEQRLIDEMRRF